MALMIYGIETEIFCALVTLVKNTARSAINGLLSA